MELRLLCPSILLLSLELLKKSLFQRLTCYFYVEEANLLQVSYTESFGMNESFSEWILNRGKFVQ